MKILVWDLPTRLFHWLFAGSFAIAYLTAESEAFFPLHLFAGLLMLVLVGFRLVWGLTGSRYARFSSFLFSPAAGAKYVFDVLKGKARRHIGHNPAGSWAIYVLILLGAGAAASGLSLLVLGESLEDVHEALANAMMAVVVLHLVGVAVESLVHRENLPKAMVDGYKEGETVQRIPSSRRFAGAVLLALVVGLGGVFLKGYDDVAQTLTLPLVGKTLDLASPEGGEHHD
jgi:Cytochrome b